MRAMRSLGILLVAVGAVGLLTLANASAQEADGQALFMDGKCNTCHAVSKVEIEATAKSERMKGPDLSTVEVADAAELATFLKKETEREGKSHRMAFKGSDEELQALITWIVAQKVD